MVDRLLGVYKVVKELGYVDVKFEGNEVDVGEV